MNNVLKIIGAMIILAVSPFLVVAPAGTAYVIVQKTGGKGTDGINRRIQGLDL